MKSVKILLAMLSNAMLLGLILLVFLDGRNPYMKFLTSGASKVYLLILCALGLAVGCLYLASQRKQ